MVGILVIARTEIVAPAEVVTGEAVVDDLAATLALVFCHRLSLKELHRLLGCPVLVRSARISTCAT